MLQDGNGLGLAVRSSGRFDGLARIRDGAGYRYEAAERNQTSQEAEKRIESTNRAGKRLHVANLAQFHGAAKRSV
jgi:hypothetical protein